jgi:hypothetical protein
MIERERGKEKKTKRAGRKSDLKIKRVKMRYL